MLKREDNLPFQRMILFAIHEREKASLYDLSEEFRMSIRWLREYLKILKDQKRIYVSAWAKNKVGAPNVALYSTGNKRDKKRPMRKTKAENSTRHYERNKMVINAKKKIARLESPSPLAKSFVMLGFL